MAIKSARKPQAKRPKNDPDEYKRFVETARAVGASDDPKDFDRAFSRVTSKRARPPKEK